MTLELPERIPLGMPPGQPEELDALVSEVAGAAVCLAAVDDRLIGAAGAATGWLGDDAAAAAAQVAEVAALVRAVAEAVLPAIGRLSSHTERLREVRQRVVALKAEQDEQFAEAWRRWSQAPDLRAQLGHDGPAVRAIVHDLEAGEASRRRRHAALLEELEDDAAATARVLADSMAAVGGRGTRGDGNRVLANLATHLPGWGDLELARRGRALAAALRGSVDRDDWEARARAATVFAGTPAFAAALLTRLGEDGVRRLLLLLGERTFEDDLAGRSSDVAGLLASAMGAAGIGTATDLVGKVVSAAYVDPDDSGTDSDYVAMGMAAVLLARVPNGGPPPMAVASWTRQVLARERSLAHDSAGARAVDRVYPNAQHDPATDETSFRTLDPVPVLVEWMAEHGTAQSAAATLGEREAWAVLLDRNWDDGGSALSDVVSLAASHPGAAGARAARSGLAVIGGALTEGDPGERMVERTVVDAVAPALGAAVAAHVSVATAALNELARGELTAGTEEVVRGLGYVSVDAGAAGAVTAALGEWAVGQAHELSGTGVSDPLPAIGIPSAYVAVQQYGQRLAHALDAYEAQDAAGRRQLYWDTVVGGAASLVPGPAGIAAGLIEGYAAIGLRMDGTWVDPADDGLVLDAADAARASSAGLEAGQAERAVAVASQARDVFVGATGVLGVPEAPLSPEHDYWAPLVDALTGVAGDRMSREPAAPGGSGGPLRSPVR